MLPFKDIYYRYWQIYNCPLPQKEKHTDVSYGNGTTFSFEEREKTMERRLPSE
jgi:hypothetical protein